MARRATVKTQAPKEKSSPPSVRSPRARRGRITPRQEDGLDLLLRLVGKGEGEDRDVSANKYKYLYGTLDAPNPPKSA